MLRDEQIKAYLTLKCLDLAPFLDDLDLFLGKVDRHVGGIEAVRRRTQLVRSVVVRDANTRVARQGWPARVRFDGLSQEREMKPKPVSCRNRCGCKQARQRQRLE